MILGTSSPNEDPLAEEHMPEPEGRTLPPLNFEATARKLAGKTGTRGSKRNGKRMDDLSRLEQVHRFDLDVDEMDKKFGKGRWTIINWHSYTTVKHVRETVYAETVHEPVIKQLDTGNLVSMPRPFVLYPYSFASPCLTFKSASKKPSKKRKKAAMPRSCVQHGRCLFPVFVPILLFA